MHLFNKSRPSLLAQLIASCAVLSACGGGGGSGVASALSASEDSTAAALTTAKPAATLNTVKPAAVVGSTTTSSTIAELPAADGGIPNVSTTFTTTTLNMPNPERGMFGWAGNYMNLFDSAGMVNLRDQQGIRLVIGLLDMSAYRGQALPQSFLDMLTAKFAMLRTNGMKVVIRPVYNYDSSGADASTALILTHLTQLAPIFAANADVIGYFQAGFIGAWGEWHNSASGNDSAANMAIIRDALLVALPTQIPVEFRYPKSIVNWFPTVLNAAQAFDGSNQSRIGVHNDCFMASDNDVGTYSVNSLTNNPQREYVKAQTAFTPFGGETCSGFNPTRQKCTDILSEGPAYHLAYLNSVFYSAFLNQWKSEGCYDEVARSMGYRFQLDQVVHPTTAARNTSINVYVDLRNVGWARTFSARKVVVNLRNTATGAVITGTGSTDMRSLAAQSDSSTRAPIIVNIPPSAAAGNYEVLVSMPDAYTSLASDPRYSVRFANADNASKGQGWDGTAARFDVGTSIVVQ